MTEKEVDDREPKDLPIPELLKLAEKVIHRYLDEGMSAVVYFKYTCEGCGSRQMFEKPNSMFESGQCEECGAITQISRGGFALIVNGRKIPNGE